MKPSPLLLADPSACLRWLVLRDLYGLPDDAPEVIELAALREHDPIMASLTAQQEADGSWNPDVVGMRWGAGSRLGATGFALYRLGYLGFDRHFPPVQRAAEFLFSHQDADGSWPLPGEGGEYGARGAYQVDEGGGYSMIPLQTAYPLRSLAACGYAEDQRAEKAYEWLLAQRLPDGAWPTGLAASGVNGYVAGYRRLAHSRWGCRSNTTGALLAFAMHPTRRRSEPARRALDLLLGRETREEYAMGFETARLIGAEEVRGFISHFARFDLGLMASLCWRLGASLEDERVAGIHQFIVSARGEYGLWDYAEKPQASRWVSFDLQRSVNRLEEGGDWIGTEARTPFQPYPVRKKRF